MLWSSCAVVTRQRRQNNYYTLRGVFDALKREKLS